ncbi:MAG: Spy/CpxP family protein refolding chaperone [Candidatus Melainabacteria bacterium]|nr:Spy/CpxP family protein refolding chaperone [Candidatus Melainabacteria bacterium]
MTLPWKLALILGMTSLLTSSGPALAQFDESDPDFIHLSGLDEMPVTDIGLMAALPGGLGGSPMVSPGSARCPQPKGAGNFSFLEGDLALTEDQYEKLFAIKNQFLNKLGPKVLELKLSERELADLMSRTQLDRQKVTELQSRINEQKSAIANLRTDERINTLEILTPEQRKELRKQTIMGRSHAGVMGQRTHKRHFRG